MEELIKVTTKGDTQVVSARNLHEILGVKTRFSQWAKQNFKHFRENIDFSSVVTTTQQNQYGGTKELQDYALTIEMAKHIAMMSGTDKGYEIRDYFIKVEQAWNSPEMVMKRALEIANKKVEQLKIENQEMKPKADKYDRYLSNKGLITITEIAKEYGMSGRELNKFLHDKRIIFKKGDKWFVYQRYANDGLVGYEIYMPEDREIRRTLKWTTKGEQFIRSLLEDESIVPVLERPSQMMIEEDTAEYDGAWFTASEIAWKLNLNPKEYAKHIGRIANDCRLKPVFADHNRYCRKIVDEYGRESYEYTAQGAMIIEKKIMEEMEV